MKLAASRKRMTVPQSRRGRRPMLVSTMLKKDKEGTLFKESGDQIPGGLADKKKPSDFPAAALAKGKKVELEHTSNPTVAQEIAMDHLTEDLKYYEKLKKVEGEEKAAMGRGEQYLPWYGTALGGASGAMLGQKLLPGKLKPLGTLGGTLLGTAVGLHGGEAVGRAVDRRARRAAPRMLLNRAKDKLAADYGKNKDGFKLQGKTEVQGIPVDIENRKGSVREGKNEDGSTWKTKFKLPYGYIKGTKGADGDEVDAYVGPDKDAPNAYVAKQKKEDGSYDEDTVMLGFKTKSEARKGILQHYDDPKYVGELKKVPVPELKDLLEAKKGKLVKIGTVSDQATLYFHDGPAPNTPGLPARPKKRRGDVPDRDVGGSKPKAEDRQSVQSTQLADAFPTVEGFNDTGKYGEALGDQRRSWEGPSRDVAQPKGRKWGGGIGGLVISPDPADRPARYEGAYTTLSELGPELKEGHAKLAGLEVALRAAFLGELQEIAAANHGIAPWPGEFEKFASSELVEFLVKEALLGRMGAALGRLRSSGGFGLSRGLQEGGAMLKGPKHVPGLSSADLATVRQMKPTSAGRRIVGESARSAGHHMEHSSGIKKVLNPIGVPLGGALEGATKQVGKELQRVGGAVRTGVKGSPTLGGGMRGHVGRALERHAGKAGIAGEIGALGTMGAALHAPLSAAAVTGGKLAPVLGKAGTLGHIGQDAVGAAAHRVAGLAHRVVPRLVSAA